MLLIARVPVLTIPTETVCMLVLKKNTLDAGSIGFGWVPFLFRKLVNLKKTQDMLNAFNVLVLATMKVYIKIK